MKYLIALTLCFGPWAGAQTAPNPPALTLSAALDVVRKRVAFVDASPEGRIADLGGTLAWLGFATVTGGTGRSGATFTPFEALVAGIEVVGFVSGVVGAVMYVSGKATQLLAPRPKLVVVSPREYMSAPGLNQFMRLSKKRQIEIASGDLALAAYLIKLGGAFELAKQYKLIPADPAQSAFY